MPSPSKTASTTAKTQPVFDGYKGTRYSKKYLSAHEEELAERKKSLTAQYWAAQKSMRELVAVKGNIDHLLHVTGEREDKEQDR